MAASLPATSAQAITWQSYGSDAANLVSPQPLDFTTYSQYTFNPQGLFRQAGAVYATGLVVDNLLNSTPVMVTIGPINETIPGYTKTTLQLAGTNAQVVISGSQSKLIATFFRGDYLGTTAGTNYYAAQIAAGLAVETGFISMFAGSTASIPVGYLLCDGTAISRTTYAGLFSKIGTLYGTGDGSTTFNLPDMTSRMPMGAGSGAGLSTRGLASQGGAEQVILTATQMPVHTHAINDPGHSHGVNDPGHVHDTNDPGHGHTVNDGGHTHAVTDNGHTHGVTDPGHAHGISDPGHAHGITDNGHAHGIADSGHTHGINDSGHNHPFDLTRVSDGSSAGTVGTRWITDGGGAPNTWTVNASGNMVMAGRVNVFDNPGPDLALYMTMRFVATGVSNQVVATGVTVKTAGAGVTVNGAGTGVTANSAATGITNKSAGTGITNNSATTGVTINGGPTGVSIKSRTTGVSIQTGTTAITAANAGGQGGATQPFGTVPPYTAVNFVIKT